MGKKKESTRLARRIKTPLQLPDTKTYELQSFQYKTLSKSEIIIDSGLCFVLYLVYLKGHGEADYPENKETKKPWKVRRRLKWSPNLERELVLRTPYRKVGKRTGKGK